MRNPRKMMPIGMLCLVLGIIWPIFFHPVSKMGQDWSDGLRGLLYGLSIGINIMAVIRTSTDRRCSTE